MEVAVARVEGLLAAVLGDDDGVRSESLLRSRTEKIQRGGVFFARIVRRVEKDEVEKCARRFAEKLRDTGLVNFESGGEG